MIKNTEQYLNDKLKVLSILNVIRNFFFNIKIFKLELCLGISSLPPLEPHLSVSSHTKDKVTRAKVLLENFYNNLIVQQRQRADRRRRLEQSLLEK